MGETKSEAEVRARLEIEIWCPECAEFHDAKQDEINKNIYSDKCGHIISVIVLGSGGGEG